MKTVLTYPSKLGLELMDQHNEVEIVISDHCDSEWDSDDEKQTSGEVKNSTQSFQILFANKKLARLNDRSFFSQNTLTFSSI